MTTTSAPNEQCCTITPFTSNYFPRGKTITVKVHGDAADLPIYVTGSETSKKVLICIYDIFGIHNNTQQGADRLAEQGDFQIWMPDFFRGKGWDTENIPPKEGRPAMQEYIQSIGSWEIVGPDLLAVVHHLRKMRHGIRKLGAYGFCFGGKKLAQAAASPEHRDLFQAVALVHPTNLAPEDGDLFNVPVALIPSGGEDPAVMNAIWERLENKPFASTCVRKDFLDGHHGFASSRSDWTDPKLAGMAREAYEIMGNFFKENLKEDPPSLEKQNEGGHVLPAKISQLLHRHHDQESK